jgi:Tfp pilus assembly PilM family ATPase
VSAGRVLAESTTTHSDAVTAVSTPLALINLLMMDHEDSWGDH